MLSIELSSRALTRDPEWGLDPASSAGWQGWKFVKLEEAVQEIKRRTDLVQVIGQTVKLKKNGPSYVGLCPFHAEKSPSFNVRPDKGFYKCFGCGAGGDIFSFLEATSGQLFIDILKKETPVNNLIKEVNEDMIKKAQGKIELLMMLIAK